MCPDIFAVLAKLSNSKRSSYVATCRDDADAAAAAAAADDDDDNDDVRVLTSRPCYRQRVTYDIICLSDEPDYKYRTVQNVTGSDNPSLFLSLSLSLSVSVCSLHPMNNSLDIIVASNQIAIKLYFCGKLHNGSQRYAIFKFHHYSLHHSALS